MSPVDDVMPSPVRDDVMTTQGNVSRVDDVRKVDVVRKVDNVRNYDDVRSDDVRRVEIEIVEQEKVYNRTPSTERPPNYNFSRSESEGNESTANERVSNGVMSVSAPAQGETPTGVVTNGNGNEIPYVLHRRHVEVHGRPSRPLEKQTSTPATPGGGTNKHHKVSRDQARLQLEQIKTDLRAPIRPPARRSPRDKSPGSGLVRVRKLPPRDAYSYQDDSVSPTSDTDIIDDYSKRSRSLEKKRSKSEEHKRTRHHHLPTSPTKVHPAASPPREIQVKQVHLVESSPYRAVPAPPLMTSTPKPVTSQQKRVPSPKHKALNDLNKPSPPKKPPRTSSNVEGGGPTGTQSGPTRAQPGPTGTQSEQEKQLRLKGLPKHNLVPPRVPPKAEMEDLTPTTDTDSDSSGGTGRRRPQAIRGLVTNTSQSERAEVSSLVSSSSSPGKTSVTGAGSPPQTVSTSPVGPGSPVKMLESPVKKVESPVCEESFSAMRGRDLPFADSVPHFSDDDDDAAGGDVLSSVVAAPGDASSEEDLEDQLNVPGLEQEEFSDAEPEPPGEAAGSPGRRPGGAPGEGGGPQPPPVPSCPPPESDISSDSEAERPTDEALPEILSVPGVNSLPPPVPSFDLLEDDDHDIQPGSTGTQSDLPPPQFSPDEPATQLLQGEPAVPSGTQSVTGTTGTQSASSPGEPRIITAIPEEPLECKISPSQPPPVTQFKYVRSDSDVPPPPPPGELLSGSGAHEISSEEEVEVADLRREDIPDLERQLVGGRAIPPPPVAPTELSSGSDGEVAAKPEEELVDLDLALSSTSRITGQLIAAELHTVTHGRMTSPGDRRVTKNTVGRPTVTMEISSESDVCDDDRADEMDDLEAALTLGRGPPPPAVVLSSDDEVNYPDDEHHHGDLQEALRAGRTIIPGMGHQGALPSIELSDSDSGAEAQDDIGLQEMDQFEKKFELHIEEDEESVTCLPEGADVTPLEGASSSVGRRSSGSTSSESALELKGAIGGPGVTSTRGLPLQISSDSDGDGGAPGEEEDLPDPTAILEADAYVNPYMVPEDEFSDQVQELPPPPPPPGGEVEEVDEGGVQPDVLHGHGSITSQYYSAASMQISGPAPRNQQYHQRSVVQQQTAPKPPHTANKPPQIAPKPPKRDSSIPQTGQGRTMRPSRPGYDAIDSDSDDGAPGAHAGGCADDPDLDRLEALESLRHPYIVHGSDSSGSDADHDDDGGSTSSSDTGSDDFEEIPEAIVRQHQIGRHHIGIDVQNRRYRNQVQVNVNADSGSAASDARSPASQHIYQNVTLSGEHIIAHHHVSGASAPGGDSSHIYQNLRAVQNGADSTRVQPEVEPPYQVLQPREAAIQQQRNLQQQQQQQQQQHGGRSPQAQVFSNPYAESFGASTAPSSGETPSSRSSQGQSRRSGSRASQSDSD